MSRLTRKIGYEYEKAKRETQLLEINNKLGKLEDLMEKYGIESVEELEEILKDKEFIKYSAKKVLHDRDTWERIAELEKDYITKILNDGEKCYVKNYMELLSEMEEEQTILDYFYTKAQEEMKNGI